MEIDENESREERSMNLERQRLEIQKLKRDLENNSSNDARLKKLEESTSRLEESVNDLKRMLRDCIHEFRKSCEVIKSSANN